MSLPIVDFAPRAAEVRADASLSQSGRIDRLKVLAAGALKPFAKLKDRIAKAQADAEVESRKVLTVEIPTDVRGVQRESILVAHLLKLPSDARLQVLHDAMRSESPDTELLAAVVNAPKALNLVKRRNPGDDSCRAFPA